MTADLPEKVLQSVDETRRSFLSKLILGSAFAVPTVASFSMSGLAVSEAFAACSNLTFFFCPNSTSSSCSAIANGVSGMNFSRCSYAGLNFHGFTLSPNNCFEGTDFAGANLSRCDLRHDNLVDANLPGANLNRANLSGSDLTGANLAGANLAGANLNRANLTAANLIGANLNRANLTNVCWLDTVCPDGTNSNNNPGGTCLANLKT
jgi:uncharacterized protein YjbI with pentapeptide repeats